MRSEPRDWPISWHAKFISIAFNLCHWGISTRKKGWAAGTAFFSAPNLHVTAAFIAIYLQFPINVATPFKPRDFVVAAPREGATKRS